MSYKVFATVVIVATVAVICAAQKPYQTTGLNEHNKLRAKHSSKTMVLNSNLTRIAEECAKDYATRGTIDHKCGSDKYNKGENLYKASSQSDDAAIRAAIKGWYDESTMYKYDYDNPQKCNWEKCGHFTQVVWSDSTGLGCAVATVKKTTVAACVYDPRGNMQGDDNLYRKNVKRPSRSNPLTSF